MSYSYFMEGCGVALRNKRKLLSLVLIILIAIVGCRVIQRPFFKGLQGGGKTLLVNPSDYGINENTITKYEMDLQLLPEENQVSGSQRVIYTNNTGEALQEIYFNIYPNAFKDKSTVPALFSNGSSGLEDYSPGYIRIGGILLNEEKTNYEISGIGETLLKIPLTKSLKPGEVVKIEMSYIIQLPNLADRFGYHKGVYNMGNWYPILAVYDEAGWSLDPYYAVGDPFYSEASNYDVNIKTPRDIVIASTGNILQHSQEGEYAYWRIEARLVRDFAWVASSDFMVVEKKAGDTSVKMYYLTADKAIREEALAYSIEALRIFEKHFGKYPYGQLSVVETYFPSGMEYPTLVYISQEYYSKAQLQALELVIVHEIAHQWWYGVVGNNQIKEAWLDESLTTYSELVYYRETKGEAIAAEIHKQRNINAWEVRKGSITDNRILKGLEEFQGWGDYGSLVYSRGAMMLVELEALMGRNKVYEALRDYYEKYMFKIAVSDDFIDVVNGVSGRDNQSFFQEWLLVP